MIIKFISQLTPCESKCWKTSFIFHWTYHLGNNNVNNLEIFKNFHDQALRGCEILPKLGDRIQIQRKLHGRLSLFFMVTLNKKVCKSRWWTFNKGGIMPLIFFTLPWTFFKISRCLLKLTSTFSCNLYWG